MITLRIKNLITGAAVAVAVSAAAWAGAQAKSVPANPMPEATEDFVEQGRAIYIPRCSMCHGLLGDGEGPAAEFMDPRPRDFTLGTFKFRTTQSGELPTDNDLFRTVSRGLPGTGMQSFDSDLIKTGLSEEERWQVIAYIKTFAPEFDDEELDPIKTGKLIDLPKDRAPFNDDTVAKGKAVFERAKCWECHGKEGRGNGQKAFDRKDDWGFPIRIRNVTHPWKIKGGTEVEDIYMRFSSGINGTPMPSFVKALSEEDRWYLANFIKSLQHKLTEHQVLSALKIEGDLPDNADDPAWDAAQPMDVRLTGQVIGAPRWQNPSIEMVTMKALTNGTDIAFRLIWDDAFEDKTHNEDLELDTKEISAVGNFGSYVAANDMIPRKLEAFRDAVAIQFPAKESTGTEKPHFFRGGGSSPVNLWHWKADGGAEEAVARGWRQTIKPQKEDQQQIASSGVWADGQWKVVMKRPLKTEDRNDVQFRPGIFTPMALNAWDGSNGEHGLIMSLSTWYFVFIEAPTPMSVYIYSIIAVLVIGAFGVWMARRAGARRSGTAS